MVDLLDVLLCVFLLSVFASYVYGVHKQENLHKGAVDDDWK